jgi:DNA-directed RNA polymerase subunit E'
MTAQLFSISTLQDVVRIPPSLFGSTLKKAAMNILKSKYESMINADLGYIIMIMDAKVESMGKMIAGDGGTYHKVEFDALTFYPKLQEILQGELVDITDFGAFVRIGPTDALLHLSQVMDDYLKSDVQAGIILANQSGRTLKVGSTIRTRMESLVDSHFWEQMNGLLKKLKRQEMQEMLIQQERKKLKNQKKQLK